MPRKQIWTLVLSLMCLLGLTSLATAQDCNSNGVDDAQDILDGTSLDCDSNAVPDECQPPTPLLFKTLSGSFSPPSQASVLSIRFQDADLTLNSGVPVLAQIGVVTYDADASPQPPTIVFYSMNTHQMNGVGPMPTPTNSLDFNISRTIQSYQITFMDGTPIDLRFPGCDYLVRMTPQGGAGFASAPGTGVDPPAINVDLMAEFKLIIDCPADITGNRLVNVTDLLDLLAAWGPCPDPPDPCAADVNGDGTVNVNDLLDLLSAWGLCP